MASASVGVGFLNTSRAVSIRRNPFKFQEYYCRTRECEVGFSRLYSAKSLPQPHCGWFCTVTAVYGPQLRIEFPTSSLATILELLVNTAPSGRRNASWTPMLQLPKNA